MSTVDTNTYVSALKELIEEGHLVNLTVSGWSMAPFLAHRRDVVYLKRPEKVLRKGDIVFYERSNGQYVLHRICRVHKKALPSPPEGGVPAEIPDIRSAYDMSGDAQTLLEKGIRRDQIFALAVRAERKGRELRPGSPLWLFYSVVWVALRPLRHTLMRLRERFRHFQPRKP
ncbi:MAG: S24/S26 family peptidase [Lachnospiraceae bacterium]|nr:S24/S26 family peptidase [Lachnospiraceae bacterium]